MGGLTDFIFGSSDEGGYKGQAPLYTPEQEQLLKDIIGNINVGEGVPSYPGQIYPGESNLQTQGFDLLSSLFGKDKSYETSMDVIDRILSGESGFDTEAATKAWETGVKEPALRTWKQDVLPAVKENFIGLNAGSSGAANRAIVRSGEDLTTNLMADLSNKLYSGEQAQLDRLLSVPGLATGTMSNEVNQLIQLLTAGGTQRGISGDALTEAFQKWQTEQGYNNPWLQFLNTALGSKQFEPIVMGPSSQSGLLQDIIGPAFSAWAGSGSGSQTISGWFG